MPLSVLLIPSLSIFIILYYSFLLLIFGCFSSILTVMSVCLHPTPYPLSSFIYGCLHPTLNLLVMYSCLHPTPNPLPSVKSGCFSLPLNSEHHSCLFTPHAESTIISHVWLFTHCIYLVKSPLNQSVLFSYFHPNPTSISLVWLHLL